MKKIEIDSDTADRITIATLKSYDKMVKKNISTAKKRIKRGEGYSALAEDLAYDIRLREATRIVLDYFGE